MFQVITHLYVQLLWYSSRMLQWRTNNRVDHTYNGLKSPRIRMLGKNPLFSGLSLTLENGMLSSQSCITSRYGNWFRSSQNGQYYQGLVGEELSSELIYHLCSPEGKIENSLKLILWEKNKICLWSQYVFLWWFPNELQKCSLKVAWCYIQCSNLAQP